MILPFDLETSPTTDAEVIEQIRASIKPPANYSKPETISKWHEENGAQALADAVAKTSFDGMYGRIACAAWANIDGEIQSTLATDSEGDVIQRFYDSINKDSFVTFCGHNIYGFDLPFLKHRSIILGIKPPAPLLRAMNAKLWDECIADIMLMWSPDRDKRASMDKLCRALGIQGKDGFDGSMVANEWENGSKEKVISYCRDDVWRTVAIYNRITFCKMNERIIPIMNDPTVTTPRDAYEQTDMLYSAGHGA